MPGELNPMAPAHLPPFITAPGHTDVLMVVMTLFLIGAILFLGNLFFRLHAMPERMAHRTNKVQFEIVAVLALISLLTHNHAFWVAGLLLALVQIPDFTTPLGVMARSLDRMSGGSETKVGTAPETSAGPPPGPEPSPATDAPSADGRI